MLIPPDPEPNWALFPSALVMTIGLAFAPVMAAIRDPKSLLRGEHLLALGPIYWLLLDLLQGAYPMKDVKPEQVTIAFCCIGLFVGAVWVATIGRQWKVPGPIVRSISQDFSANTYFALAAVAFFIGMLKFAIPTNFNVVEMIYYLGQGRWAVPWGRGQLGGWDAFLDHAQYFGYLLPALTVVIARRASWLNWRTLISAGMALIIVAFIAQSGSRRIIGVIVGMAFILWILSQERLRVNHVMVSAAGLVALLAVMQVMVEYRKIGLGEAADAIEGGQQELAMQRDYLHVDDNIYRLCQIIELIPESYPYVYHKYVVWILIRPIPRVFWPGKPIDAGFDLPSAVGAQGVSYSCSAIGELYMSLGLIGVALGGLLYGRLAGMASQLLTRGVTFGSLVIYSTLMMALFAGMRSMLELILVSYVVLAWSGLSYLFIRFKGRKTALRPS
ncbi:MAG: oligosaccharide repeat unit polymerase [Acidobacteriota bacterium]|nr:oligosaccharide repeat unit polymerase [Acidobacteriota bacterium]